MSGPARNRVTPLGEVVAIPQRGAFTGNRGRLHRGREIVRFHAGDLWIICALEFNGRWDEQWRPNRFTWLFFHDEAVALAAGHRPCGECRHAAYVAYRDAWASSVSGGARPSARDMNRRLHAERLYRGTHRRRYHLMRWTDLPDGAFAFHDERPHLVLGRELLAWTAAGYADPIPRPTRGEATVITPPASVDVLRAGYPVVIRSS